MRKKRIKIGIAIILMVLIYLTIGSIVNAAGWDEKINTTNIPKNEKIYSGTNKIIGIIQIVGITVSVIILILIGINIIKASPEGKAEVKKRLIVYTVGVVLILTATGALQFIKTFTKEVIEPSRRGGSAAGGGDFPYEAHE